jgi:hypothetical protein
VSEAALVEELLVGLRRRTSPWGRLRIGTEFNFQRGRTDVVAVSPVAGLLAFEAKLTRWREALQQAYRNRCFARRSFVVLPEATAEMAVRYDEEFRRRRVGVCTVANRNVSILIESPDGDPLQGWLASAAICHVRTMTKGLR